MSAKPFLLGIDQGTSGSRALVMDREGRVCGYAYQPLARIYPQPGWVEQAPRAVAAGVAQVIAQALAQAGCQPSQIAACGIACQRNTAFVWHAETGMPLANAITWQDLRTLPLVESLGRWEDPSRLRYRLGYQPGPYMAALHLAWRMEEHPEWRVLAAAGQLRIGLSAAWLLAALGRPAGHLVDYTLAQATGLFDFRVGAYWPEWLERLAIPASALAQVVPTVHEFGALQVTHGDGATADVPVLATIGDQQAALLGYDCRQPGQAECTHGTASFVDVFVGDRAPEAQRLNAYYAWVLGTLRSPQPFYCLEADTTVSGAAVRWMRQNLGLFERDEEIEGLVASVPDAGGVVFVPAFTGLNVPYGDPAARGTILGLTLASQRGHIVRAFLEAIGYQLRAILETIAAESGLQVRQLHVGGGVSGSDAACQIQADLMGIPVLRSDARETTSRAAALLAGLGAGFWSDLAEMPPLAAKVQVFEPRWPAARRDEGYRRWQEGVARATGWAA